METIGEAGLPELEGLLLQVLDAPDGERELVLAAICAAHPQHAATLRHRLANLSRFGLIASGEEPATDTAAVPARIGAYRIERVLGQGGMGVVYLAEHEQLRRRVALKFIRPEFLHNSRARERFARETQTIARLQHPGLCTLYETGEWQGQPFLAMQFVAGETLDEQLRRARARGVGAWSRAVSASADARATVDLGAAVREATALMQALAEAVHVVHEAGLVHRDLKPGNVMIAADGKPVLLDFGLARDLADASPALTVSTDVVGTPAYMAPEQVEPRGRTVDRRADVHALGALLYECLTLRPPLVGSGREDTYRRILTEAPVELRRLQPACSRDLASVVHKALAKEPSQRFATAQAFAEELSRVLHGQPTRTRPPGPWQRLGHWVRQRPATAAALGTVGVALTVGLAVALLLLRRETAAVLTYEAVAATQRDSALGAVQAARALDLGGGEPARSALYAALGELRLVDAQPLPSWGCALAASRDGRTLVAGTWDNAVGFCVDGQWVMDRGLAWRPRTIRVADELQRVLVITPMPTARLYDLRGNFLRLLPAQPPAVMREFSERKAIARVPVGVLVAGFHGDRITTVARNGVVMQFDRDGRALWPEWRRLEPAQSWTAAAVDQVSGRIAVGDAAGRVGLFTPEGAVEVPLQPVFQGRVHLLAFDPHGQRLLASTGHESDWWQIDGYPVTTGDYSAAVLDRRGSLVRLYGHRDWITSGCWSDDGRRVLTTSHDATARVWDVDEKVEGQPAAVVLPHERPVNTGCFLPSGAQVVTGGTYDEARLWQVAGVRATELRGHQGSCWGCASADGGRRLITLGGRTLLQWDASSRWTAQRWVGEGVFGYFSDGRGGWSLSAGGVVQRWDEGSAGPAMEHRLPLHATELIRAARWWRRGGAQSLIVVGTTLGRLLCCDVRSGETSELRAADADPAPIMWIATRGDGLLFHQEGTEIVEWRPGQERRFACRPAVQGANDYVPLVGNLTRDGRRLVIGTTWGEVCFLDVEAGAPMQQQGPVELDGSPWVATWDAEGRSAFALTVVGSLYRVTPGGGAERLFALPSRGVGLNISNDGSLLAVGGADGLARILDREGRLLLTLSTGALRTSAFGTDNRELVTMTIAGECRTWPLQLTASGKELLESSPYQAAIARARAAVPATWVEPVDPIERYARLAAAGDPGAHAAGARYIDDAIETQAAPPLNRIAWRIVDPARPTAEAARDLDLAQRAAEAAVAISKRRNAAMLDTLARVYAWRGDFAQALAIQEEALQVLDRFPGTGTRANLERTLAEYRSRR